MSVVQIFGNPKAEHRVQSSSHLQRGGYLIQLHGHLPRGENLVQLPGHLPWGENLVQLPVTDPGVST